MRLLISTFCVILLFTRCEKLPDLDFVDLLTKNEIIGFESSHAYSMKDKSMGMADSSFVAIGTNGINDAYLYRWNAFGEKMSSTFLGSGDPTHFSNSSGNNIEIIGNDGAAPFFIIADKNSGIYTRTESFLDQLNTQIGLIDTIQLYGIYPSQGGFFTTGYLKQSIGNKRLIIIKHDFDGQMIWGKTFFDKAEGRSVCVTNDGSVYVLGTEDGEGFIARFNEEGVWDWRRKINNLGGDDHFSILGGNSSQVFLSILIKENEFNSKVKVMVFDSTGTVVFDQFYGSNNSSHGSIALDMDGFLLLGTVNKNVGNSFIEFMKINPNNGAVVFSKRFSSATEISTAGVGGTNDCGYYFVGSTENGSGSSGFHYLKMDHEGEIR